MVRKRKCISSISFLILYLILLLITKRLDRNDKKKWAIHELLDNQIRDKAAYHLTISTGHFVNSGTKSRCYLEISNRSKNLTTRVHSLKTTRGWMEFSRASMMDVILRDVDLGDGPYHFRLWHDNSGKGSHASWYIDQIILRKISSHSNTKYFIFKKWLAVDQDDFKISQTVSESLPDDGSGSFLPIFILSLYTKLVEDHIWISVFFRTFKSNFTRSQRLTCCVFLTFILY